METCYTMQQSEELGIFVTDEDDKETLLIHRISSQNIYEKENGSLCVFVVLLTIVSWGFCLFG